LADEDSRLAGLAQMDRVQMRVGKVVCTGAPPAQALEDARDRLQIQRAESHVIVAEIAARQLHEHPRVRHVGGVPLPENVEHHSPGVTVSSTSSVPRSTLAFIARPIDDAPRSLCTSSTEVTSRPSSAIKMSPSRKPPAAAGLPGSTSVISIPA